MKDIIHLEMKKDWKETWQLIWMIFYIWVVESHTARAYPRLAGKRQPLDFLGAMHCRINAMP